MPRQLGPAPASASAQARPAGKATESVIGVGNGVISGATSVWVWPMCEGSSATAALKMATDPLGPAAKEADVSDLAAWTTVANVVMNLDEFLMRR